MAPSDKPVMHAVYSGAVGGATAALLYGMNQNISLPGGMQLRAPLGMAIHVGLASYVSDAFICPALQDPLKGYDTVLKYSCDVSTAVVTPALLTLAGDRTVGIVPGALIGGLSHMVADVLNPNTTTQSGHVVDSAYGGSRMYSSGSGYQYGSCSGGCGGCGQSASMYSSKY